MNQPSSVLIKRKRHEDAPDTLVLEPQQKRAVSEAHVLYVRRKQDEEPVKFGEANDQAPQPQQQNHQPVPLPGRGLKRSKTTRVYHLDRGFGDRVQSKVLGKRKGQEDGVATFVERPKRPRSSHHAANDREEVLMDDVPQQHDKLPASTSVSPFKSPGKRSAVKIANSTPLAKESPSDRKRMEMLSHDLYRAALENESEIVTPTKPQNVVRPKVSPQRSREAHRQRTATDASSCSTVRDVEMSDDSDYVYDTYVLAPTSGLGATQAADEYKGLDNVGYLVITKEDRGVWETYLEDEPSDKDWDSDEDDENAEGHYGAEYPEDELASDDEFNRNAYRYRRGNASDEEEWDVDYGTYSDDEYERMMDPFGTRVPKQLAKYLEENDESG